MSVMGHLDDLSAVLRKPRGRLTAIRAGIDEMPDYGQALDQAGDAGKDAQGALDEAPKMLDDFNVLG